MSDIQIIKLVFGILLSIGTLVLCLLTYFLGWKKWYVSKKACTQKVEGTVVGYTLANRSKKGSIHLPIVQYMVEGKKYKVVGPKYKWIVEKGKSSVSASNQTEVFDPYETVLNLSILNNSLVRVHTNPFEQLFPKGSVLDVYYDPNHPKKAYVLRYVSEKFKFYLLLGATIVMFLLLISILVFL